MRWFWFASRPIDKDNDKSLTLVVDSPRPVPSVAAAEDTYVGISAISRITKTVILGDMEWHR